MKSISLTLAFGLLGMAQLIAQADLNLELTVDDTQVDLGQIVTFTITLRNDGPENTIGAEVLALLPAGYEFVAAEATDSGRYNPATGIWDATGLGAGIRERLILQARVVRTVDLLLLAEVLSSEHWDNDSYPNNGVDTNGNGNTVDDPGDEDDGDGQRVIAGRSSETGGSSGIMGGCLAPVEAESSFEPNPEDKLNSVFNFDYRIESVVKFQMADMEGFSPEYSQGDPTELHMTYYVNSSDGSMFFPGGEMGFFKTNFNYTNDYGTIDGAVWLSNGQMVTFVEDARAGKKRAITRESAQTGNTRYEADAMNMLDFFQSSLNLATIADPLPDYVQWPSQTKGFRGVLEESLTGMTNVIDMYFDTASTPIRTSCIMMGFLVGVLKDSHNSNCNRLVVYTKVHIGGLDSGDSMEGMLKSIKPIGISFDGSAYEPMTIGGDTGTEAASDLMDYEDRMRYLLHKRELLESQRRACNSQSCRAGYDEFLETNRKERYMLICEYSVKMGMHSSIAECMAEEE